MLVDRKNRIALFRVCIAASDDAAEAFLLRVAEQLELPAPGGGQGPLWNLQMSAGSFRDWKVELELRTPAFPPAGPGLKMLALKGDGVVLVAHQPSSEGARRVVTEVKSALEELGYAWEPYPRVGYVLEGGGADDLFGDTPLARGGDGVMDAIRALTARMIDLVKSNWPT